MRSTAQLKPVYGPRVLVVEDEALVSMMLEDMLDDLGCAVIGPAASLSTGLAMAREGGFDAAVLDVNLAGQQVFPIADVLAANGVPFVFATGYGRAGLREQDGARPVVQKPYSLRELETKLRSAGVLS